MSEASELLDMIGGAALPRCDLMLCDGPRPEQSIYGHNIRIIACTGPQFTHSSTGAKTAANRRTERGKIKMYELHSWPVYRHHTVSHLGQS